MPHRVTMLSISVILISVNLQAQERQGFERLVVQRSSGGGGIQETYEISSDGKYKFSDLKSNYAGQLEGDDLRHFVNAVNTINWAKLPKKKSAVGNARFDAKQFQYSIAIVTDKTLYNLSFHESAYADDKAIVALLIALAKLR